MKIRCRYPWDAERDLGYMRPEGVSVDEFRQQQIERLTREHPALRPCGRHHSVVVKASCVKCKCAGLIEVIGDEDS